VWEGRDRGRGRDVCVCVHKIGSNYWEQNKERLWQRWRREGETRYLSATVRSFALWMNANTLHCDPNIL
jgi:hypothetical protein